MAIKTITGKADNRTFKIRVVTDAASDDVSKADEADDILSRKPMVLVLAGPNGSGKSTITRYL
ncbi:MAG: hypothetical protein PHR92_17015 [Lachnospiraceae bacterium]|nr:hypothetical protein [Lachnospiraceae bacterium]